MSNGEPALQAEASVSISRRVPISVIPITPYGKYTLIGKLGHGGMAEVFLAYVAGPAGFRKLAVIKRLHPNLEEEPGFIDMFLDEARLAARLSHPNVVQTYEVGDVERSHFIAMEYLEGQGLDRIRQRCHRSGQCLTPPLAARMISEALSGLHYAHELRDFDGTELGVIHRDISPQNVFVTYEGGVKLLDFGIAKAATHVVETRTGVIKGKFAYIAPEQARSGKIDRRADIWSMGVVLWEVLAGRRLFKGPNDVATLNESLTKTVPSIREIKPEVPEALEEICTKALMRDREQRYQTALEMKNDLRQYLMSEARDVAREDVAAFVKDLFGDVILQTRQVIKTCLSDAKSERGLTTDEYRYLIQDELGEGATPSGIKEISPISQPSLSGIGVANQVYSSSPPPPLPTDVTPSNPSGQAPGPERKRGAIIVVVLLALLLPLGIGIGWMLNRGGEQPTEGRGATGSEPTPELSATPSEPVEVALVSLTSSPPGAEVVFGGKTLGRTPLERELNRLPAGVEAAFIFRLTGHDDVIINSPLREEQVSVHADLGPSRAPSEDQGGETEPGEDEARPPAGDERPVARPPRRPLRPRRPPRPRELRPGDQAHPGQGEGQTDEPQGSGQEGGDQAEPPGQEPRRPDDGQGDETPEPPPRQVPLIGEPQGGTVPIID